MRTVNFRDAIVYPIVSRQGYDPEKDLFTDYGKALARYINSWVRKSFDAADFPELSRIEPRVPVNHLVPYDVGVYGTQSWNISGSYNLDSVVRDPVTLTDVYYSKQNANTGHALSDNAWWQIVSEWNPKNNYAQNARVVDPASGIVYVAQAYISPGSALSDSLQNPKAWLPLYTQQQPTAQITDIGKVLKVYIVDPRTADGPFDIPFRLEDTAIHVGFDHGTTVWIKFMSRPPVYSLDVWDKDTAYSGRTVVFEPVTGNCYFSATDNNLNHPPATSPTYWILVPFPAVIADVVWRGAYSDALREEGQTDKATVEEQAALQELKEAIARNLGNRYDMLTDQQTGVPRAHTEPVVGPI